MRALIERVVRELAAFERPSASDGERRAAEWIAGELRVGRLPRGAGRGGARARRLLVAARAAERRRAAGRRARPPGRRAGRRGSRPPPSTTTCPAAGSGSGAARCRTARPGTWSPRPATRDAERTIVFVAHHDAAHSGLVFHPALPRAAMERMPKLHEKARPERPDHLRRVPRAAAAGALGPDRAARPLRGAGAFFAARRHRHDGGHRPQRGGARAPTTTSARWRCWWRWPKSLAARPAAGRARDPALDRLGGVVHGGHAGASGAATSTRCRAPRPSSSASSASGSPQLCVVEGEGMLRMRDYTESSREALARARARRPAWSCAAACAPWPPPTG